VLLIPEFGWTYNQLDAASALLSGNDHWLYLFYSPSCEIRAALCFFVFVSTTVVLALAAWSACLNTITELLSFNSSSA
jgi:hypothetical protein